MRIRTQFILTMVLFAVVLVGIGASVIITKGLIDQANDQERLAISVAQSANQLSYLSSDYLIYGESQQLARWQAMYTLFSSQVSELRSDQPEAAALIRDIQTGQQRVKEVFDSIASAQASQSQNATLDRTFFQVSWSRMAVQSQSLVSDATRLEQLFSDESNRLRNLNMAVILVMLGIFATYFVINYIIVQRRMLASVMKLQDGAKIVGSGNLDFRVQEKRNDEIGDLARSFNLMTANLKEVTASKAELEKEIEQRKRVEEELYGVNRELRAIGDCNQALVRATSEQSLLEDICRILCDVAGYRMAWVGRVEHDSQKSIKPLAWGGVEDGYLAGASITWADTERGHGPTGTAARTGKTQFFQDFMAEPSAAPWREAALARGYSSSIAIPLLGDTGAVFAVLTLYADKANGFNPAEVNLLQQLAADLAFGIGALRTRAERNQAEQDLLSSERKFKVVATSTPDHILMQDSGLRYVLVVNPQLGLKQEDMIGKTDYDILAKEDADRITEIKKKVMACGSTEYVSTSLTAKDGSQQYFEGTYVPTYDIKGRVDGVLGYFRNITERVKMEEDLLNGRERFQLLSEANSLLLTGEKPENMIQTIATRVMEHLGCDAFFNFIKDEAKGRLRLNAFAGIPLEAVRDIEWLDIGVAVCGCVARDGCRIVSENIQENGDERADLVRSFGIQAYACHPLHIGDETVGTLSFGTRTRTTFTEEELDVMKTVADRVSASIQRSRVEESLRETRDYLNSLFNYANAPIIVWDTDLRITRFNHAFELLTGLTADQALGSKIDILFPEDSCDASMQHILDATAGKRWEVVEIPIVHTDGSIRILLWNSASIYAPDGKTIVATMAQGQDITERKKSEQVKDEFIGLVSHELKTPVTVIVGAIDTAQTKGVPKKEALQLLQDAAVSAEALAGIVDNLLELSRAQANRLVIKREPVDIRQAAENVVEKLKNRSDKHKMEVQMPERLPKVAADRIRVERILHNLVENAIKYSPKGGSVKVFASPNGDSIMIGVKDQGIGITPQDQERLFKPFERLGTVRNVAGVGLGLNVCRRLVEAHNGRIWVESEPGKGTTFYFSLPLSTG